MIVTPFFRHSVHLLLLICWAALVFLSSLSSALSAAPYETLLAVEGYYSTITDLTAEIRQVNILKSLGKRQRFGGSLYIKKPGRLRLDYSNGQQVVIDGKTAWFYSRKNEQVVKRTFTDFDRANIPVAFLLGAASIADDFTATAPDPERANILELVPRKPGAIMKKIRIKTDPRGRITHLTIFDKSGNITEIEFFDIREDTSVQDQLFSFTVPKGTEIIDQ